jgi:hypothetical protein
MDMDKEIVRDNMDKAMDLTTVRWPSNTDMDMDMDMEMVRDNMDTAMDMSNSNGPSTNLRASKASRLYK